MRCLPCLALLLAATLPALAQENSLDSKIVAIEKAWNQAYKSRDKKALGTILHDSIVFVNDDGSVQGKADFLNRINTAKSSDDQQAEPESISVLVYGDVAIATGVFREKDTVNGKQSVHRLRFLDTWINRGGSWVCVAASATPAR